VAERAFVAIGGEVRLWLGWRVLGGMNGDAGRWEVQRIPEYPYREYNDGKEVTPMICIVPESFGEEVGVVF
jgi:hypothetical protein